MLKLLSSMRRPSVLLVPKSTVLVAGWSVVHVMTALFSVMSVAGFGARWMLSALTSVLKSVIARSIASVVFIVCFM